jgi:hypothetical protein
MPRAQFTFTSQQSPVLLFIRVTWRPLLSQPDEALHALQGGTPVVKALYF